MRAGDLASIQDIAKTAESRELQISHTQVVQCTCQETNRTTQAGSRTNPAGYQSTVKIPENCDGHMQSRTNHGIQGKASIEPPFDVLPLNGHPSDDHKATPAVILLKKSCLCMEAGNGASNAKSIKHHTSTYKREPGTDKLRQAK